MIIAKFGLLAYGWFPPWLLHPKKMRGTLECPKLSTKGNNVKGQLGPRLVGIPW